MPGRTEENCNRLRSYSVLLDRELKPGVWNDRRKCHVTQDACELTRASGNVLNRQSVRLFGGRQRVRVLYIAEGD